MKREEYVYVIGSKDSPLVKIGKTNNLRTRLSSIQNMSPAKLEVLWKVEGYTELELALHQRFAERRQHGEWFDLGGDPVATVTEAAEFIFSKSGRGATPDSAEPSEDISIPEGVWLAPVVRRVLKTLDRRTQEELQEAINSLIVEPRPQASKPLKSHPDWLVLRLNRKRVLYELAEDGVRVLSIAVGLR